MENKCTKPNCNCIDAEIKRRGTELIKSYPCLSNKNESNKEVNSKRTNLFEKLIAKYRLSFGLCPKCNSDAPEIDNCDVCESYRTSYDGMPTKELKEIWWNKFTS